MDRPTKDCLICKSKSTDNFCSEACKNGQMSLLDLEKSLKEHKFDKSDTRIFFFDHKLSELFDLYTIELLKTFHSKNIKKQHYHWNRSNLLYKTIVTKINRDYVSPEVLREYCKYIERLYKINAQMWEMRKIYHGNIPVIDQSRAIQYYFDWDEDRSVIKNEIDLYCGEEAYNEKEYNG